jgi:hypothetical protein
MSDLAEISISPGIRDIGKRPIRHKMVCEKEEMRTKITEILNL